MTPNRDRQVITDQIRAAYVEQGKLGQESRTIQTLQPKRLDEQAIAQAYNYEVGDVIRFRQSTPKFPSLYYRVMNVEGDRLQLKDRQGETVELPIYQYKEREVFRCHELELREGDRLRFTRNQRDWEQINGQMFTVERLNENGTIQINSRGKFYEMPIDHMVHADYAYCRTVYGAQGWTAKEAIWAPGQRPGKEQTYVALSRAKENLEIITLDRQALGLSVTQSQAQDNALDLVQPQSKQPIQTSLLPGVVHETELKPKRKRSQPFTNVPEGNRDEPQKSNQTVEPDGAAARPLETDGAVAPAEPRPVEPGLKALDDLARDFAELANLFDRTESTPESEQPGDPDLTIPRDHSDSAPDLGTLDPEFSKFADSDRQLNRPGDSPNQAAESVDGISREPIEPDSTGHPETPDPIEPDPDVSERQTIEPEDLSVVVPERDAVANRDRRPDFGDDPESTSDADLESNQRQSKQPGDQPEKDAQALAIEEQQRLIEISRYMTDDQLLSQEQSVHHYFKSAPPKPDWLEGQRLKNQYDSLQTQQTDLSQTCLSKQQALEQLGPARSLRYPFGASPKEVKQVQSDLDSAATELQQINQEIESVKKSFKTWQKPAKDYLAWRDSDETVQLRKMQAMIQVPDVKTRLTEIKAMKEQEAKLKVFDLWAKMAMTLDKPTVYIQRICEVKEKYRRGNTISDHAKQCFRQDQAAYQRLLQAQKQAVKRRGPSLGR